MANVVHQLPVIPWHSMVSVVAEGLKGKIPGGCGDCGIAGYDGGEECGS